MALFGSYARGDQQAGSDVDILVEVDPSIGLDFVTLAERIEKLLGVSDAPIPKLRSSASLRAGSRLPHEISHWLAASKPKVFAMPLIRHLAGVQSIPYTDSQECVFL